jgi:hypothetical protein
MGVFLGGNRWSGTDHNRPVSFGRNFVKAVRRLTILPETRSNGNMVRS